MRAASRIRRPAATTIEYAVMLALLAVGCVAAMVLLGNSTEKSFRAVASVVDGEPSSADAGDDTDSSRDHSLAELAVEEDDSEWTAKGYRRVAIAFSCFMNLLLWGLLLRRKRRESLDREAQREAERQARKSPEEVLHRKRRKVLTLFEEAFGDFLHDRMSVRDVMSTDVNVCRISNSALIIHEKMLEERLRHVMVCDSEDRLVGVITRSDISPGTKGKVREYMSADPVSIAPDAPLTQALQLLIEEGVTVLPVVAKDGAICGVLVLQDILLLLQGVQMTIHRHREELSHIFFCQRKSTSISDVIASTIAASAERVSEADSKQSETSLTETDAELAPFVETADS